MKNMPTLDKKNIENILPLTPMQEGMLFHYLKNAGGLEYIEQMALTLQGEIDKELFIKAWGIVAKTNEVLRTVFRWDKLEKPLQIVLKEYELPLRVRNFCEYSSDEQDRLFNDFLVSDRNEGIDLLIEPLRLTLCHFSNDSHAMIITNHHILYDGWSNGVLLKEFFTTYQELSAGRDIARKTKPKYSEFIKFLINKGKDKEKAFWEVYLRGFDGKTELPFIGSNKKESRDKNTYEYIMSRELLDGLQNNLREMRTTLAAYMYTGWGLLLQRYCNSDDVIFGTTVSGRNIKLTGIEEIVGLFIATPPLRIKCDGNTEVASLIKSLDSSLREREEFESASLVDIKSYAFNRSEELFESIIVIENYPLEKALLGTTGKIKVTSYQIYEHTNYALTVSIEAFEEMKIKVSYDESIYEKSYIQRVVGHYVNILRELSINPNRKISEIKLLSEGEERRIIFDFNNTYVDYPKNKTIHQLFEEQVERTPDNIAVVLGEESLTYRELNGRANYLAHILREKGVRPDNIVGIMVERSFEMIIGIMGILKAGGAYLPIDLEYPRDRIRYMLEDSGTSVLLVDNEQCVIDCEKTIETVNLKDLSLNHGDGPNLEEINKSNDLAYVVYTSGSTGRPKGVMVEHRNLNNLFKGITDRIDFRQGKAILALTTISFDIFALETLLPLTAGMRIVIAGRDEQLNPDSLDEILSNVEMLQATPSRIQMLINGDRCFKGFKYLKEILLGGEPLPDRLLKDVKRICNARVYNLYGPTETTVWSTLRELTYAENIDIGSPIANTQTYIVDKFNNPVPVGVTGELCIGGDGLARGYLHRPELTTEKFVEIPFILGKRMYKTGDLAKWLPDGNIEFLGRLDHQVKVRGFRIELGEIETELLSFPKINEAVVVASGEKSGEKYLTAYIVKKEEISLTEIREHLGKALPGYMIPSYFIYLDKMPLTPNGKVDRKALPAPDGNMVTGREFKAPGDQIEEQLCNIWKEILNLDKVGITDNFFELGGHSLKATMLVSKIHKEMDVEVPLREVFKTPTVMGIAEYIKSMEKSMYEAIEPVEKRECYLLSSAQKRLYILNSMDKQSISYNLPVVMMVEGNLEREKLEKAINDLLRRHESLRTSFHMKNEEPVQKIHEDAYVEILFIKAKEEELDSITQNFVRPFELDKAPLMRLEVVEVGKSKSILLFDMHHIISDGISMNILIKEFVSFYKGKCPAPLKIQYKDYSDWQNRLLQSEKMKKQEEYWLNRFQGEIPVLNMPLDNPRPAVQSYEGSNVDFVINNQVTECLRRICRETSSTLYMILLAAYNILLYKYTGQKDIVVGSPIAGRPHVDLEGIIGMFVNTLAMRNFPDDEKTFREFLAEVKKTSLEAFENQDYQFEELVGKLEITRDISRNPLFDTMFVLQNIDMSELKIADLKFIPCKFEKHTSKFDLGLTAIETEQQINFSLDYCAKLFHRETMERLTGHFINILGEVVRDLDRKISEIEIISEDEKREILYHFNNNYADYPKEKTIVQLFEEQVERTPGNIAVVFGDRSLTYRELNEKANQLAFTLREKGVGSDTIVAIMVQRSFEMITGIMGILKAGGAYLPIDPESPQNRIRYIFEDCQAGILVTGDTSVCLNVFDGEIIGLNDENLFRHDVSNPERVNNSKDSAYVIYTSGTTGKPKGVVIEHRNIANLVQGLWGKVYRQYSAGLRVCLVAPYVFDASVKQIFAALFLGHSLYLVPKDVSIDGPRLATYYIKYEIDISDGTPLHLAMLSECIRTLKERIPVTHFIIGGEALQYSVVKRFLDLFPDSKPQITNVYGPTECSVDSTAYLIDSFTLKLTKKIPIGTPLCNQRIYILRNNREIVPVGVVGELYISGAGVGRGYLGKPNLTAEKFLQDPFNSEDRMYRTGDLARWLSNGNIDYLGRIDHQVKIRGYRIELNEIEIVFRKQIGVKEFVVLDREDNEGNKFLCGFIVKEGETSINELRNAVRRELPEYMVPGVIVEIESIPFTSNGKVDKKALFDMVVAIPREKQFEAPRNPIESQLVEIWRDILGVTEIGIHDNFFELGGHSLRATILSGRVQKELSAEIGVRDVFENPTIAELGEKIHENQGLQLKKLTPLGKKENYHSSFSQMRLYAIQMMNPDSTLYNIPMVLELMGKVDLDKIQRAITAIIKKHEGFRTSFHIEGEEIVQKVQDNVEMKLEYKEVNGKEEVDWTIAGWIKPFRLNIAPLLRGGIIKEGDRYLLMLDMHHMICDGTTLGILAADFAKAYQGVELKSEPVQHKEYALWEREQQENGEWKQQRDYWIKEYAGEIPVLGLPTDSVREKLENIEGNVIKFEIGEEIVQGLYDLMNNIGGTLYMVLMAGYSILLSKYARQEDIVIGTPIAGRRHPQMETVAGMFVNTLAIRTRPEGEKVVEDYLREMKQKLLAAYENQEYPYEELLKEVQVRRDLSRNPLFDVMLAMQNAEIKAIQLPNLQIGIYRINRKIAQFDLTLIIEEINGKLICEIEYRSRLYKQKTIEQMIKHLKRTFIEIGAKQKKVVKDIELIGEDERKQLLYEFNNYRVEYDREQTVVALFEEQVSKFPDKIAIVYGEEKLTYRELNEKANGLSWKLSEFGIGNEEIVAVIGDANPAYIIIIMGILKSGGAFLPILPQEPEARIEYYLKDSQASCLITQSEERIVQYPGVVIDVHKALADTNCNKSNLNKSQAENAAYIIYTSGTTGQPKGVVIEHRNLMNQINGLLYDYGYHKMKNHMLYSKPVFDVSVQHIFTALCGGATLHLMDDDKRLDYQALYRYIKNYKVDFMDMVPAQMAAMVEFLEEDYPDIRLVLGGETFPPSLYQKIKERIKPREIYNVYGPTETTINALIYKTSGDEQESSIPIGKPMRNYRVYILNRYNQLQPVGVPGELCISGSGVAREYLNRPELTAEKFVENPYESGQRMFRTGDLARWLPNGNVEFLGRMDNQVKIRGYRIELGEIEYALRRQKGVKEAVVLNRNEGEENNYLCGYIVKQPERTFEEIIEGAKNELPDYMMPRVMIEIEQIPLTINGKIDREALLMMEPDFSRIGSGKDHEYEAPRCEIEEKLTRIWEEILGVHRVGIHDNFFELGGHSLRATTLSGRIQKELSAEIGVRDIFEWPTIAELAEKIRKIQGKQFETLRALAKKEFYDASSAQKRIYAIQMMDENSTLYNMPLVLELTGKIDRTRIEKAITSLIQKHEAFRTSFHMVADDIFQKIHDHVEMELEYKEANGREEIDGIIASWTRPFMLNQAPLMRGGIINQKDRCFLMLDMHHIISDGATLGILAADFAGAYQGIALKTEPVQYKEYAAWEREQRVNGKWDQQKVFWKNEFAGEIPVLELPTDGIRGMMEEHEGDTIKFQIGQEIVKKLKNVSGSVGGTLFMGLMAGYSILVSKYAGQEDVIIGTPIAGRKHPQMEKVAGMFVNTLAIRTQPKGEKEIIDYLREIKQKLLTVYENQEYPYEEIIETVNVRRNSSRNPLFDVMLVLQNTEMQKIQLPDIHISPYEMEHKKAKFDINLTIEETEDDILLCEVEYRIKLYRKETIRRMMGHFENTLRELGEMKVRSIREIQLLGNGEKERLLYEFNNTVRNYDREKTIIDLFEEQVRKTPENIAVINGDKKVTYLEINARANRMALKLSMGGVCSECIVGIMVERSIEMMVALLGILKAGGAYLPIDITYPEERKKYLLEHSNCRHLVSRRRYTQGLELTQTIWDVEDEAGNIGCENLERKISSQNAAYVIYTSGSTGKPKGVIIEHGSLINYLLWASRRYVKRAQEVFACHTTLSFDLTVTSLFTPLIGGHAIKIFGDREDNIHIYEEICHDQDITMIKLTPSHLKIMNHLEMEKTNFQTVIVGGEQLETEIARSTQVKLGKEAGIYNEYGPTEATVGCIVYQYQLNGESKNTIPIGKPIDNTNVYILDVHGNLQPVGVPGELCIGGDGLSREYLNHPDLTTEKFVKNPFKPGERMYKTGDLARWLSDGNIEFLGRIDHQVKVRGFRIELGEIESQLLAHGLIRDAVVQVQLDAEKNNVLVAYFVAQKQISTSELRDYLERNLPKYMIPQHFLQIDVMPLTASGKADRKALLNMKINISREKEYQAPTNEIEAKLVRIWEDLLGIEQVGIDDDFFELGGQSIKGIKLIFRIQQSFDVKIDYQILYLNPNIRDLAQCIKNSVADRLDYSIPTAESKEFYETSYVQKRMWLLNQLNPADTAYNMPGKIVISDENPEEAIEAAFNALIAKHESFRTFFCKLQGQICQQINNKLELKLEVTDLTYSQLPTKQETMLKFEEEVFNHIFDLSQAPLFTYKCVKMEAAHYEIVFSMHHIISDGWSMEIIQKDFNEFYTSYRRNKQIRFEPLRIQYKDYASWQNQMVEKSMSDAMNYWQNALHNYPDKLRLPERPENLSIDQDGEIIFYITKGIRDELTKIIKNRASIFSIFLSSLYVLLYKITGQNDIVIGAPVSGREHFETEKMVGCFVNTLLLRAQVKKDESFTDFLEKVSADVSQALTYQTYPLELVLERAGLKYPDIQVFLNVLNLADKNNLIDVNALNRSELGNVKFDIVFYVIPSEDVIQVVCNYKRSKFDDRDIQFLCNQYIQIINEIVGTMDKPISEIASPERRKLGSKRLVML